MTVLIGAFAMAVVVGSAGVAYADTVIGDRIDVVDVIGNPDGTQTFAVSYKCGVSSHYPDLLVKTEQQDGLGQVDVFGEGVLGTAATCTGSARTAHITVRAVNSAQWITGGLQNFSAMFCTALSGGVCTVDTADDSTIEGSKLVLGGKGGVPPAVPADTVKVTGLNRSNGQVTGT